MKRGNENTHCQLQILWKSFLVLKGEELELVEPVQGNWNYIKGTGTSSPV